jgi:hypothetical protein
MSIDIRFPFRVTKRFAAGSISNGAGKFLGKHGHGLCSYAREFVADLLADLRKGVRCEFRVPCYSPGVIPGRGDSGTIRGA